MSVAVDLEQLFADIELWGFGYLVTVSDDARPHLVALTPLALTPLVLTPLVLTPLVLTPVALTPVALTPEVSGGGDNRRLRFDAGGGKACRNAAARPQVSIVFPPADHSDGFSLVVDGEAMVDGSIIDVRPTWAVLHRPAP